MPNNGKCCQHDWTLITGANYCHIYCNYCDLNLLEKVSTLEKKLKIATECIEKLKYGCDKDHQCWCDVSIGDPRMSDHSESCKLAQETSKQIKEI